MEKFLTSGLCDDLLRIVRKLNPLTGESVSSLSQLLDIIEKSIAATSIFVVGQQHPIATTVGTEWTTDSGPMQIDDTVFKIRWPRGERGTIKNRFAPTNQISPETLVLISPGVHPGTS